jgi:hypothetical protein
MLGRYPRSEYDRIRTRLENGAQLDRQWQEAQSAANRQQMADAEKLLIAIIGSYDTALHMSFDLEAAKLELASLYLRQNRGLKARQWIGDVQKGTANREWRKQADELAKQVLPISVRDAFDGRTIAVYCCARSTGQFSIDMNLAGALTAGLIKESVQTITLHDLVQTGRDGIDDAALGLIACSVEPKKADAVFIVLLDIDKAKSGTQVQIPGTHSEADVFDARLTYYVVRTPDGRVLATGSTVGMATSIEGMVSTILTNRHHLPSHAPDIAEALGRL